MTPLQLEQLRQQQYRTRLALLLAMQDVGNPLEVIKVDYLSPSGNSKVDLTGIVDSQKLVDKYLKLRMATNEK